MATFTAMFDIEEPVWVVDIHADNRLYFGTVGSVYFCRDDAPEYEIWVDNNEIIKTSEDLVFATQAEAEAYVETLESEREKREREKLRKDIEHLEQLLREKRAYLKEAENAEDVR